MGGAAVHVLPDDNFDDWIVRQDDGGELGHYPTREAAEAVAEPLVRERKGTLVVHLPDGRTESRSFAASWLDRLVGGI